MKKKDGSVSGAFQQGKGQPAGRVMLASHWGAAASHSCTFVCSYSFSFYLDDREKRSVIVSENGDNNQGARNFIRVPR